MVGTGKVISKLRPCPGAAGRDPRWWFSKHTFYRPRPNLAGRSLRLLHL